MARREISVSEVFSPYVAGRYVSDGPYSGQQFRDQFLLPALDEPEGVVVLLDGKVGYGPSFLEEVFGGLVRVHGRTAARLRDKLKILSHQAALVDESWSYVDAADRACRREAAFVPGLYRHYKGGLYTALGLVTHHETRQPMVKYVSHTYGGENVRPLYGWETDRDGWSDPVVVDGKSVARFTLVGELPSDTPINQR